MVRTDRSTTISDRKGKVVLERNDHDCGQELKVNSGIISARSTPPPPLPSTHTHMHTH